MTTAQDLLLVGAGYWGKNLARNFHQLGCLAAIVDSNADTLSSLSSEYSGVEVATDPRSLLNLPHIRKVAIAAPAAQHYELARAALLARKDVFVEKPLCLDLSEAESLVELAEDQNQILMVGHMLHYHPAIIELKKFVQRGDLGRLQYISSNRLNLGKFRQEENALWSFAPHDISVILSLTGNALPLQIQCTGESYLMRRIADTTLTVMRFADQCCAHVFVSWLNPFKEQRLTVIGSKGMAVFDDTKTWPEKLMLHQDYLTWKEGMVPSPSNASMRPVPLVEAEPLKAECVHFLECCQNRSRPRTDGLEGLRVLRVLKAAQQSLDRDGDRISPQAARSKQPDFFVHATSCVSPSASIGEGSKIWHFCHVMDGAKLGPNCSLGQNVVISPGVVIGGNVKIQNNVSIYSGTIVEDDVFLGPSCVLTNVTNPRSQVNRQSLYERTLIRRGATIGANATIVCGISLGQYCFVAAGAVVTKDVPDYALVKGSPARMAGWMSRHGHKLTVNAEGIMICPESKFRYREVEPGRLQCLDWN